MFSDCFHSNRPLIIFLYCKKKENKSYLQALFGNEIICGNLVIKGLYFGKDKPKLKKKTIAVFHTTSKHCMLNKICKNLVFLRRVRQLSSTKKKKKNLINNLNTILKKTTTFQIFFSISENDNFRILVGHALRKKSTKQQQMICI